MDWDRFVDAEDQALMESSGFGRPLDLGGRLALLVIDMTYNFCGREPLPIREAIARWPMACGAPAWEAAEQVSALIRASRTVGIPVIYSRGRARRYGVSLGQWAEKNSRIGSTDPANHSIIAPIAPLADDLVIEKDKPSAFHGTQLLETLIQLHVDSLLICGATTSGCVRASVVDAFSYNFRVGVVSDGCVDRSQTSHWVSLFDMHMKYGEVMTADRGQSILAGASDKQPIRNEGSR